MNPSSPAPDFEDSEYQPQDRAAPALTKSQSAAPGTPSSNSPALPGHSEPLHSEPLHSEPLHSEPLHSEPRRGEVFDVELDENGQIREPNAAPKRAGWWFFAALAALFCTYNLGAYVGQKSKTPAPVGEFTAKTETLPPLRLQIAGRVKKPGVYTLPGGARIEDALKTAGGALPGADLSALNLADWAVDGSKIEVPARQIAKVLPTPTPRVIIKEVFVTPPQNSPDEASTQRTAAASQTMPSAGLDELARQNTKKPQGAAKAKPKAGKTSQSAIAALKRSPVDLNRASADQLASLPGVGPKMAERIIAYRAENGGFKSVTDLDNVKGIGEKRMEMLKDLVKIK